MVEFASAVMPIDDDPRANTIHFDFPQSEPSGPMRRAIRRDRFFRDYAVLIIGTLLWGLTMMAGCIITGIIVRHNTETRVREEDRQMYEQAIADYQAAQAESEQAKYWLSGEASLEAQINAEATDLCRAGWIWTTDEAFLTFCCNVWMRTLSPLYPGSVAEVLRQEGQYDFAREGGGAAEETARGSPSVPSDGESPVPGDEGRRSGLHSAHGVSKAEGPGRSLAVQMIQRDGGVLA